MKRFTIISASIAVILSLASCKEDTLDVFGSERYIHFTEDQTKEFRYSFATAAPGTSEYTIKLPMEFIGRSLESDLNFSVSVVSNGDLASTAATTDYTIGQTVFHKDSFKDSLNVTLRNSDALSTEKRLTLRLTENENFKLGPEKNCVAVIYFSNVLSKPSWWAGTIEKTFLGEYSDIKYQHFIVATGVTDLEGMETLKIKALVTSFIYYLRDLAEKGTPAYESDGKTELLATIPYNKFV